jgi:hypothetical protein
MGIIQGHTRSKRWVFYGDDGTRHVGVTEVGLVTQSGQPYMIIGETEEEILTAAESIDFSGYYSPLPNLGELVREGETYGFSGKLVICRQDHERTLDHPDDIPALFATYQNATGKLEWIANEQVHIGDIRNYTGQDYIVIQAHQTQSGWEPPNVPALWKTDRGLSLFVQPQGAHDAYGSGERCLYNSGDGTGNFESVIDANVWAPDVFQAGWIKMDSNWLRL